MAQSSHVAPGQQRWEEPEGTGFSKCSLLGEGVSEQRPRGWSGVRGAVQVSGGRASGPRGTVRLHWVTPGSEWLWWCQTSGVIATVPLVRER